ncbi:hypothetical protein JCM5296_005218 [Sporobolomyces johnsonii]
MFWRQIPRATDVLARLDPEPQTPTQTQNSVAKPLPATRPPPPSAPPPNASPPLQPPLAHKRSSSRLSFRGHSAMKKAVEAVMEEERQKREREGPTTLREVVDAALAQETGKKRSVVKLAGLLRKRKSAANLDDRGVPDSKIVPFDRSPESEDEEGRRQDERPSLDRADLTRSAALVHSPSPTPTTFASIASERRPSQRPPSPSSSSSAESDELDLPPYQWPATAEPPRPAARPLPTRTAASFLQAPHMPPPAPLAQLPPRKRALLGVTGLSNLGNTCYLSAVVLCLAATKPLADFLASGEYRQEVNTSNRNGMKGQLAASLAKLIRALRSEEYGFFSPAQFRHTICLSASQFHNHDQHDAHEFLLYLLDGLHEDLNLVGSPPLVREKTPEREAELERLPEVVAADQEWAAYRERNDSIVIDFFQGQLRNRMECTYCQQTSTTFNAFQTLSLSIPCRGRRDTSVRLEDCIEHFLHEEILKGDNAWNCPRCRRLRSTSKRFTIARLPQFLIIHLKRFASYDSLTEKVDTPVHFPLDDLELGHLLPPMALSNQYRLNLPHESETNYELHALCNHFGDDAGDGHYTAIVRNDDYWVELDDERMTPLSPAEVLRSASSAYLLFYRISGR